MIKELTKKLIKKCGYQVTRHHAGADPTTQFEHLVKSHSVDVVIDIGANSGQFYREFRGYNNRVIVISIEALPDMVRLLQLSAKNDELWEIIGPLAIGNKAGDVSFNVAKNSVSSSTKTVLATHTQAERDSECIKVVSVQMATLDEVLRGHGVAANRLALKIDVQGAEHEVLEGAQEVLNRVQVIACELSLVPLYEGQKLWKEMIVKFDDLGFELCGVHRGFSCKRTGDTLQLEGLFRRK